MHILGALDQHACAVVEVFPLLIRQVLRCRRHFSRQILEQLDYIRVGTQRQFWVLSGINIGCSDPVQKGD